MSTPFYGPLDHQPIIERLSTQVPALERVSGAAEFAAALKQPPKITPQAFVMLAAERAASQTSSALHYRQRMTSTFAVVTVIQDYRAAERGAAHADAIGALLAAARAALLGWQHPDSNGTGVVLAGTGRVIRYQNARLYWQDNFAADYYIRK